ncbi:ABC transporter ATP-binding protein [Variovorax sp. Sphag1AA]|uniref:ABC transporter ATP-binding protein n=1 Tax=Variovorax sp. Sphag1AA TaxID=2587027 RepID=UPI00160B8429|nr:ABC transporter ATP-binding protein [Variovorax sp. Sphag1AA]MBB3180579.1 branched-chain amino acid transport system ATP-binding protein [Variovorax sp. Sphag1AA]
MSNILEVQHLSIAFGGVVAVDGVSFNAPKGEILSIIGPNGAGKTTLFNMVSGLYTPRSGSVRLQGKDVSGLPPFQLARIGMSRTFQNLQVFFRQTALENVMIGRTRWEQTSLIADLLRLPSVRRQNAETRDRAYAALERIGLAHHADTVAGNLSYGSLKRLEIARALASEPTLLLLDEPAAGCNAVETEEIEHIVRSIAGSDVAIVLIEHDMKMVMRLSHQVLVLNQGRILARGTPDEVRNNPEVITAYLGSHAKEVEHAAG